MESNFVGNASGSGSLYLCLSSVGVSAKKGDLISGGLTPKI